MKDISNKKERKEIREERKIFYYAMEKLVPWLKVIMKVAYLRSKHTA